MAGVLVAAVDAPAIVRSRADYLCDGVADEVTLEQALAVSDYAQLSEGTFTWADTPNITSDNKTINGTGRSTLIKITGPVTGQHIINVAGTQATPIKGVTISNLRIQGYGDDAGVTLDHGIRLNWCNSARISNIWAHDVTYAAIHVQNSEHCTIDNIHVERGTLGTNGGWYGVSLNNSGKANRSGYHTITNVTTDVSEHGLSINECDDCTCSNIVCRDIASDYAINFTACWRVVLTGFTLENCDGGVFLEKNGAATRSCDQIVITNGILSGPSSTLSGIQITDAPRTVVENVILNMSGQTSGNGVKVDLNSDSCVIKNCQVNNSAGRGIYVENGADNCAIEGNVVTSAATAGIEIGNGNYNKVIGNHVETCVQHGILLSGRRITCMGNTAINNDSADAASYDGIRLSFADFCTVTGNIAEGNDGYQINIFNVNCENNIIAENWLDGTGAVGVINNAGTATRFRDNYGYDVNWLTIPDGVTAPTAVTGFARIFVDTADGDLKIIYGDSVTKLIVADT